MLSNFLIHDSSNESNLDYEIKIPSSSTKYNLIFLTKQNNSLVENIDDNNYNTEINEIKYKIFDDISSISNNSDNLELILTLPTEYNIISINKIKLSDKLNKYVKNIYLIADDQIIISMDKLFNINKEQKTKIIKQKQNNSQINNIIGKNINLHIILDKDSINHIINKNIFVNYSFIVIKNKFKYLQ